MIDVWEERGDDEGVVDDSNDASEAMEEEEEAIEVTVQESRLVSKQVQYGGWRTVGRSGEWWRAGRCNLRPSPPSWPELRSSDPDTGLSLDWDMGSWGGEITAFRQNLIPQ